jgi:hypothetical protein
MHRLRTLNRRAQSVLAWLLLALLVLATLSAAGGAVASHLADGLTVTVRAAQYGYRIDGGGWGDGVPRLVLVKTFQDGRVVVGVQQAINSVTVYIEPLGGGPTCVNRLPGQLQTFYSYDFALRWHGVQTQDATFDPHCVTWVVHTLGWPDWLICRSTTSQPMWTSSA